METFTITRVGTPKTIETKFGPKVKTGVQTVEYPDVWHDVWAGNLMNGQKLEGTRTSREYQGKTYWSIELPKKSEQAVQAVKKEVGDKLEQILNDLTTLKLGMRQIASFLETNMIKRTSDGKPMPFQDDNKSSTAYFPSTGEPAIVEYPDDEETIKASDIPF